MLITTSTNASKLIEHMGDATIQEAKWMLKILIDEGFQNIDTSDIPEDKWEEMAETAVRFAEENPERFA